MQIAIFASGSGSNAAALMQYFAGHARVRVGLVVCNNPGAGVIAHAEANMIPVELVNKAGYADADYVLGVLAKYKIDLIVLAGFLKLIPEWLIDAYPGRILNIHPALLPKFGGKGMYGMHIHEAVRASGVTETGLTIHLVNSEYDKGAPLFQVKCSVYESDTASDIAARVLKMEHRFYPKVVEAYATMQH